MTGNSIAEVQQGIPLAEILEPKRSHAAGSAVATAGLARGGRGAGAAAADILTGPFLSPGSLTPGERTELIDGVTTILEGLYTHLPLKRARYGFDPVQRLRILRTQVDELTDDGFHYELADIVTRLRDAHTRYVGPSALGGKVAVLPFLVEMIGSANAPAYLVTHVGIGLDAAFKPGVTVEYWNGVPIDRAVQRHSDREVGGRPDSQRAWATQSLTSRSLQYGPPPDEYWVVVGYRTAGTGGRPGTAKETKIPWKVVDPGQVRLPNASLAPDVGSRDPRLARAVDPAAEAIRQAKMLLFAPHALSGEQAPARAARTRGRNRGATTVIPTELRTTLQAKKIDAPGGPFGYLRIWAFDTLHDAFITELLRLIPLLPDRGLIIDIRGNPGGYIWAAECALQLFTPNTIQPTRFSVLATPFTRALANAAGPLKADLAPWKDSLDAAVRNGELYAQPLPITDSAACNALGQQYGGPVVLVGDATSYSAGDLFAAGFVDNAIGSFVCVGSATGAGGANVYTYDDLRHDLVGSPIALPTLPDGISLSFSFRRATRSGPNEGRPIEDIGIEGRAYAMTLDDLLFENRGLISDCIATLEEQPLSQLGATVDTTTRTIAITTGDLERLDVLFDGHPGSTHLLGTTTEVTVPYPEDAEMCELVGFSGTAVRQRRRIML